MRAPATVICAPTSRGDGGTRALLTAGAPSAHAPSILRRCALRKKPRSARRRRGGRARCSQQRFGYVRLCARVARERSGNRSRFVFQRFWFSGIFLAGGSLAQEWIEIDSGQRSRRAAAPYFWVPTLRFWKRRARDGRAETGRARGMLAVVRW